MEKKKRGADRKWLDASFYHFLLVLLAFCKLKIVSIADVNAKAVQNTIFVESPVFGVSEKFCMGQKDMDITELSKSLSIII